MPSYDHTAFPSLVLRPLPLVLLTLLGLGFSLFAQSTEDLRVNNVRFSQERSPYGRDAWLEMEIEVDVRGNPSPTAPNREFLDDLTVEVALAHNLGNPSRPRLEYFWTVVELPTLKRGIQRLRFYLSPDQVERGRIINDEPYAWYAQIVYGDPSTDTGPALNQVIAVSANLRDQSRLDRFLELMNEQKEERSGILLPQAETPFRDAYPDDTPTIQGQKREE